MVKFFVFILISLICFSAAIAEEVQPLGFEADGTLEYAEGGNLIVGKKNVRLTYGNTKLRAEEVVVYIKEEKVVARGDVVLTMDGKVFNGTDIEYYFKEGRGRIKDMSTVEEPWHIKGKSIERISPQEYRVYDTELTSCDLAVAHYHFSAKKIKLYPHERIWVENAVMWIGNIPVFYLPVYTRSLKGEPYGLVVSPGYDREKGFFVLSHYNWFINHDLEGRIYFDPVERQGLGRGFDIRYGRDGVPLGYIYGYQMREDNLSYDSSEGRYYHPQDAGRTDRRKVHARHRQDTSAKDNMFFEINKFSDKEFNEDFYSEEKWRGWKKEMLKDYDQQNVAEFSHREDNFTFTITGRKQLNDFFDVTERLPEVNFDLSRKEVLPHLYFDTDASYAYLRKRPGWQSVNRGNGMFELSRPMYLFGWLNLTPAVIDRLTWYSRGETETKDFLRHYWGSSIGMETRVYKAKNYPQGVIEKSRHVVEPRLTYYYFPDINLDQNRLFNFDSIDRLDEENRFNIQLVNRVQAKKKDGALIEWFRAVSETNYGLDVSPHVTDFNQEFLVNFTEDISMGIEGQYDFHKSELETLASDIFWQKGPWQVSLGTTYYLADEERSNLDIEEEVIWNFSPLWRFGVSSLYDMRDRYVENFEVSVYRDLHCWEAQFIAQKRQKGYEDRDELRFYIAFNIKALPNKIFGISKTTDIERRIKR